MSSDLETGFSALAGDAPAPVKEMILALKLHCLHDDSVTIIKIVRTTQFRHLLKLYADSKHVDHASCKIFLRGTGQQVMPDDSPDSLDLSTGMSLDARVETRCERWSSVSSSCENGSLMKWYLEHF